MAVENAIECVTLIVYEILIELEKILSRHLFNTACLT